MGTCHAAYKNCLDRVERIYTFVSDEDRTAFLRDPVNTCVGIKAMDANERHTALRKSRIAPAMILVLRHPVTGQFELHA
jgi:hypothetical protein